MPIKYLNRNNPAAISAGNSVLFNGSSQYLTAANNSALQLGTSNFTIEGWFYVTAFPSSTSGQDTTTICDKDGLIGSTWSSYGVRCTNSGGVIKLKGDCYLSAGGGGATGRVTSTTTINTGTWYHFAYVRNGANAYLYINGTQEASAAISNFYDSTNPLYVGYINNGSSLTYWPGYISNFRIVKGTAVYTSNFTPSTSPLTAILNTVLLTCQSATIVDNSTNNFTITNNGSATVSSTVPFTAIVASKGIAFKNRNNVPTTQKAIFGYGSTNGAANSVISTTNKVSNTGVVSTDTTGVGTGRMYLAAAGYGTDKAIFGYGQTTSIDVSMTNLVSNTGVVAADTTGVGTSRHGPAAAGYGTDKAIFGYGYVTGPVSMTNLVSNTGVVATDTTGVGTARSSPAAARYGTDKAIFGYGYLSSITNLVSNIGVVASDTTGVGTARYGLAAAAYGTDKAIFGYGYTSTPVSITNLVSNTGVVATDTSGVGTARYEPAASGYGGDKAIFGYGDNGVSTTYSMTNLVSNTGVVATDTTGVGTARSGLAAASYSNTGTAPGGMKLNKVYADPYMVATGGNLITTSGSYKVHQFTTVGTSSFTIISIGNTPSVEYLIVGGGGGGGAGGNNGGGGAGGLIYNTASLSVGTYTITIGQSGSAAIATNPASAVGGNGGNSTFNGLVALGGGGGSGAGYANNGGSGGGGFLNPTNGIGLQPTSSYGGFGNNGGSGYSGGGGYGAGGGGGAGAVGADGTSSTGGNGGNGKAYAFAGASTYYAGGGGGSVLPGTPGTGGLGGGGAGINTNFGTPVNATGYGSGGGGGLNANGGAGSPGIILIKYRYTA